jgi:hypothetical protein
VRLALVALCGCNSVLGVHSTEKRDAAMPYYDAPFDAPFACPPLGTAPRFTNVLRQAVFQDCTDYTTSAAAGLAVASCSNAISAGPIDMPLTVIVPLSTSVQYYRPRLSPEGDAILMFVYDTTSGQHFEEFREVGGTWTLTEILPFAVAGDIISAPTRSPNRHVLVVGTDASLHEMADQGGNVWTETAVHPNSELGVGNLGPPYLSTDGLRLMMGAVPQGGTMLLAMYTDRDALDQPFRPAVPLVGVPGALDGFMTEDCSRIYMSGLESIFYVQQM